jgi:hypothetical protein
MGHNHGLPSVSVSKRKESVKRRRGCRRRGVIYSTTLYLFPSELVINVQYLMLVIVANTSTATLLSLENSLEQTLQTGTSLRFPDSF